MKPIRHEHIRTAVAREIQAYIQEVNLQAGDKLPPERELAESLGVGRSSLREAFRLLEAVGVIEVRRTLGAFVSHPNATLRVDAIANLTSEKRDLLDLLRVRGALEKLASEAAAEVASNEDLTEMERCLVALEDDVSNGRNGLKSDLQFHESIYHAAHNRALSYAAEAMRSELLPLWDRPLGNEALFLDSWHLHRPIFDAIATHDSAAAGRAVDALIAFVERRIRGESS